MNVRNGAYKRGLCSRTNIMFTLMLSPDGFFRKETTFLVLKCSLSNLHKICIEVVTKGRYGVCSMYLCKNSSKYLCCRRKFLHVRVELRVLEYQVDPHHLSWCLLQSQCFKKYQQIVLLTFNLVCKNRSKHLWHRRFLLVKS